MRAIGNDVNVKIIVLNSIDVCMREIIAFFNFDIKRNIVNEKT
ncbi:hypothetical protein JCM19300_1492 [Algibacter lectus]|uniref:Uncharacterized protein n=1 Tax=Algibacter lectus TaxID=221126 RepID=A0A090VE60_9FLAO|nr:hypothetical protein DFQ06_0754 [Algibacter lectus]GAL61669.1 hypothetical protein JCM19300_1492 [Algibacter lectus]GAL77909.1 hypothetical protein JCM19274_5622 [Algibacter lectus]